MVELLELLSSSFATNCCASPTTKTSIIQHHSGNEKMSGRKYFQVADVTLWTAFYLIWIHSSPLFAQKIFVYIYGTS